VRDLFFAGFIGLLLVGGLKRPFLWVLAYAYIDIVAPQRLAYGALASVPLSMIVALLAIGGWVVADRKDGVGLASRQILMLVLLLYCGVTTFTADFPIPAGEKWEWVWKAMFWAIFLPLTLRTRLRIEAYLLVMLLSAAAIVIVGGIKTALSGGGYGALNLMVDNNSGLYEGSQISTVAIAIIPLILWFSRFGTIYPSDWKVKLFCYALIFACLLMPVGTEARTGLVCIAFLFVLMLRDVKRRFLYLAGAGLLGLAAIPFLPQSFTQRMETIQDYQSDQSAGTRLAVWAWTLDYVRDKPLGGGFEAYIQNRIQVQTTNSVGSGAVQVMSGETAQDAGRAWHSAYFEMLGEQGFPGLFLWLLIHLIGLARMERLRRRYWKPEEGDAWISPLATALQHGQLVYLVGAVFVGIAFQPFVWMILAVQIAFDRWIARREAAARGPKRLGSSRQLTPAAT
jgi:probable O-glycosylation ligase (exosortase A-associated)